MSGEREPRKGRPGRTTVAEGSGEAFSIRRKVIKEIAVAEVSEFSLEEVGHNGDTTQMLLSVKMNIDNDAPEFDRRLAVDAAVREAVRRLYPET